MRVGDTVVVVGGGNLSDDTYLDGLGRGVIQSIRRGVAVVRFEGDTGCLVAPLRDLRCLDQTHRD